MSALSRCSMCHSPIWWATTSSGGIRSVDITETKRGTVAIERRGGQPTIVGTVKRNGHTLHIETCRELV